MNSGKKLNLSAGLLKMPQPARNLKKIKNKYKKAFGIFAEGLYFFKKRF